jgi:hypothetical protein
VIREENVWIMNGMLDYKENNGWSEHKDTRASVSSSRKRRKNLLCTTNKQNISKRSLEGFQLSFSNKVSLLRRKNQNNLMTKRPVP